ncbi:hypothetical protein GH714_021094 [Hevea brasiliensis]|uniref:Uncharacterized protein n=1 Tax=Hevea brasiliensis TaxID=3981 RepID=A0A6A6MBU9_HEVBR|nr:hypothetical protein GH714_021094 [Hevea brasiliensis]
MYRCVQGYACVLTFPDEVLDLDKSVRTLDLTHNKLVDIPMEISKLVNMQRLILADNLIERLPMNLGKLQSLKVMMLDGNQITSLPDELGQLVRLERLSIQGNMLTFLPETIGSLRNLSLLNVSNNKLKTLPESIGSCFSLEELQANDNLIEDLPGSVCNLVHLKSLSLDNNNVNQIPSNLLKDCKALQNISLHDNPISMDQFQQKAEERILPTKEDIVWVKDQIRVNGLHMQENVLRKGINPSTRAQQLEDLIQDELSPMAALRYELPSQGCLSRQPLIVRGEDMEFFKFGSGVGKLFLFPIIYLYISLRLALHHSVDSYKSKNSPGGKFYELDFKSMLVLAFQLKISPPKYSELIVVERERRSHLLCLSPLCLSISSLASFIAIINNKGNVGETIEIGNLDPKIATFRIDSGKLKGVLLESGSPEEFQLLPKLARSQPSVDKSKLQKASSVEEVLEIAQESLQAATKLKSKPFRNL